MKKVIDRTKLLNEIPESLRPLCEEVMILMQDAESSRILTRHRLGQLVDLACDVRKNGTRALVQLALFFRVSETTYGRLSASPRAGAGTTS